MSDGSRSAHGDGAARGRLVLDAVDVVLDGRAVLRAAHLEAHPGQVLVVVGPNGAGKSTLLRVAAGLRRPDGGRVRVDDEDVAALSARARARRIALVPQEAHLDHPFSVREVVAMGRYPHRGRFGGPSPEDRQAVDRALGEARLSALASRPVTHLSGGERRRVLIARALAQDPAVLLLDEPTANMDLGQVWRVHRTMRAAADEGRTVVVVVHDLEAAALLGDRVALMAGGRVLATGPSREVLTAAQVSKAFGVRADVSWERDGALRVRVVDASPS